MMVIFQTRRNLGGGVYGPQYCHSGGDAHKFYATIEMWLEPRGKIKKKVRNIDEEIGNFIQCKITKSKLTGLKRNVKIRILDKYGVDDVGSCVDWMVERGFWNVGKKDDESEDGEGSKKGVIDTGGDFDCQGKFETLVKYIESKNYENDFKKIVGNCWKEIEQSLEPKRKPKYG